MHEQPQEHLLTDTDTNVSHATWSLDQRNATAESPPWSIDVKTLHGGRQEGSQLLTLKNGAMDLALIPTRGLGILSAKAGDVSLGWSSPIKEVVHPSFINLDSRDGLGWLEGFNEWMCRCGLEFSGHPGEDRFVNNVGDEATMKLTLHGKIANIPASRVSVEVREDKNGGPPWLAVRGLVREQVFHGPKLELTTEILTQVGSTAFRIHDIVTNRGSTPQEFQMLYHCNFGSPLLEKGAKFVAPVATNEPFNARAAEGIDTFDTFEGPVSGFVEQVYCLTLQGDKDGRSGVLLKNAAGDRGASMRFSLKELPYFTFWKNPAASEDGYVTGLEPGTSFPGNRGRERAEGRVPVLAPGASRSFSIDVTLHASREDIARVAKEICGEE